MHRSFDTPPEGPAHRGRVVNGECAAPCHHKNPLHEARGIGRPGADFPLPTFPGPPRRSAIGLGYATVIFRICWFPGILVT